jgi:hypothetical protein
MKSRVKLTMKGDVKVLKTSSGPVTLLDRFKQYYVQAITVVGTLLLVLNQVTPLLDFVPASKSYVTIGIAVLTSVSALLKNNETWVEDL